MRSYVIVGTWKEIDEYNIKKLQHFHKIVQRNNIKIQAIFQFFSSYNPKGKIENSLQNIKSKSLWSCELELILFFVVDQNQGMGAKQKMNKEKLFNYT